MFRSHAISLVILPSLWSIRIYCLQLERLPIQSKLSLRKREIWQHAHPIIKTLLLSPNHSHATIDDDDNNIDRRRVERPLSASSIVDAFPDHDRTVLFSSPSLSLLHYHSRYRLRSIGTVSRQTRSRTDHSALQPKSSAAARVSNAVLPLTALYLSSVVPMGRNRHRIAPVERAYIRNRIERRAVWNSASDSAPLCSTYSVLRLRNTTEVSRG